MKTMSLIVTLILSLAPLGSAWANSISQTELNSVDSLSAFSLSLTGELSSSFGSEQGVVVAQQTPSSQDELKLHPAQLSIPGLVDEDVLQPKSLPRSVAADQK